MIAESFERIHRSNLVGMGILPLKFMDGQNAESLGLKGDEVFDISGLSDTMKPKVCCEREGKESRWKSDRVQSHGIIEHRRGGELLPQRRHIAYGVEKFDEVTDVTERVRRTFSNGTNPPSRFA